MTCGSEVALAIPGIYNADQADPLQDQHRLLLPAYCLLPLAQKHWGLLYLPPVPVAQRVYVLLLDLSAAVEQWYYAGAWMRQDRYAAVPKMPQSFFIT